MPLDKITLSLLEKVLAEDACDYSIWKRRQDPDDLEKIDKVWEKVEASGELDRQRHGRGS